MDHWGGGPVNADAYIVNQPLKTSVSEAIPGLQYNWTDELMSWTHGHSANN